MSYTMEITIDSKYSLINGLDEYGKRTVPFKVSDIPEHLRNLLSEYFSKNSATFIIPENCTTDFTVNSVISFLQDKFDWRIERQYEEDERVAFSFNSFLNTLSDVAFSDFSFYSVVDRRFYLRSLFPMSDFTDLGLDGLLSRKIAEFQIELDRRCLLHDARRAQIATEQAKTAAFHRWQRRGFLMSQHPDYVQRFDAGLMPDDELRSLVLDHYSSQINSGGFDEHWLGSLDDYEICGEIFMNQRQYDLMSDFLAFMKSDFPEMSACFYGVDAGGPYDNSRMFFVISFQYAGLVFSEMVYLCAD